MQPILFKKQLFEKIWGGRNFKEILNIPLPDSLFYGESWEISGEKTHVSVAATGIFKEKNINELIHEYGDRILGRGLTKKFNCSFPLLVKFLDINDKLSIQVHPDNKYAKKNENSFGKHESWYVIHASEDAEMILGLKKNIKKTAIIEKLKSEPLDEIFNIVKIKVGDFVNITPGTVHATFKGSIMVYEVQQTSDATYRLYDYDRVYNGKKRELHLDRAIDVIRENSRTEIININPQKKEKNCEIISLTKNRFYKIDKLVIDGTHSEKPYKYFKILSAVSGEGKIIHSGENYELKAGMTYLIPANLKFDVSGRLEILESYI